MPFFPKACQVFGAPYIKELYRRRPEKVRALEEKEDTSSLKDVRAFLGLVAYFRKFNQGFGITVEPLYRLLNKSNKFEWSAEYAVTQLKKKLLESLVLGYPIDRERIH